MIQEINLSIDGEDKMLKIESEQYNNQPVFYILNDDIGTLFNQAIPEHLMLMEQGDAFVSSPRLLEVKGRLILNEIWKAIKQQSWE